MEKKFYEGEIAKNNVIITSKNLQYNNQSYMWSDFTSKPIMSQESHMLKFVIFTIILAAILILFNYVISPPFQGRYMVTLETLHHYGYFIDAFLIVIFILLLMIMFTKYRTRYYIKFKNEDHTELKVCISNKKQEVQEVYDALNKAISEYNK